jgi:hypothetical protein
VRVAELLASTVADRNGRSLGPVRDVRIGADLTIAGLVVGRGVIASLAHAWGYAERRAAGPWPLRALTASATRAARFVPAEVVVDWGPGRVRLSATASELPRLDEVQAR